MTRGQRKVRLLEPQGRPGRPFNAWLSGWPLLGPLTLGTLLEQRGYDAGVYNENVSGSLLANPRHFADVCSADVVGISVMTPTAARGYALADRIRRQAPQVRVVLGGIHATFMPQEAAAHADVVVRGEGENVIEAVASGDIQEGIVEGRPLEDLDSLPPLNYELMADFDRLVRRFRRRDLYQLPLMTSRGCPYNCRFCSVSRMFGHRIRRQSAAKVLRDLEHYARQGFRQFFFYDDNFTVNRKWTLDLMERVRPLGLRFSAQTRADFHWTDRERTRVDRPLLAAMRRAGGHMLYIGYETLEESTAARWQKGYRGGGSLQARLADDTRILHENGFWIHGMFVIGPQHTAGSIDRTVEFATRNKLETLQLSILTPFPGTLLFEDMRPHLLFTDYPQDWDFYDGTHCVYDNSRLGLRGLQRKVLDAHRRFYRYYGCSGRKIRDAFTQRVPLSDRLWFFLSTARIAARTLRQWEKEVGDFLQLAESRGFA